MGKKHFYSIEESPSKKRYREVQEILNRYSLTGRLWNVEEDPEVDALIEEFKELEKKHHPQVSDPLNFSTVEFDDENEKE